MGILEERGPAEFPHFEHIKSNTTVLFRRELKDEFFDNLHQYIDHAAGIVSQAIDRIFPDSHYAMTDEGVAEDGEAH